MRRPVTVAERKLVFFCVGACMFKKMRITWSEDFGTLQRGLNKRNAGLVLLRLRSFQAGANRSMCSAGSRLDVAADTGRDIDMPASEDDEEVDVDEQEEDEVVECDEQLLSSLSDRLSSSSLSDGDGSAMGSMTSFVTHFTAKSLCGIEIENGTCTIFLDTGAPHKAAVSIRKSHLTWCVRRRPHTDRNGGRRRVSYPW